MDLSSLTIFKAMTEKMRHLGARQQVLARNIANADTPGYVAMKVTEPDFKVYLQKVSAQADRGGISAPQVGVPGDLDGHSGIGGRGGFSVERDRDITEIKPTGNTVVLEDQLMSMAEVQLQYNMMTNLMRKQTGMLRTALGKGR